MTPRARRRRPPQPLQPLLLAFLIAAAGCEPADVESYAPAGLAEDDAHALPAGGPAAPLAAEGPTAAEPPSLAAVRSEAVQGRTGPGGIPFEVAVRDPGLAGHDRLIGRRTFRISLRGGGGTEYPCGSCHRPGEAVLRPERSEDAHRNLLPRHPEAGGSPCITCHAPDQVDRLVLIGGERVPLAHAYRLCGQCHYPQADAWAAGAHGKRLDGWRGRRVVMGCADCHDPHQPAVESRVPFPGPRPPGAGARSP
ncbi:MAG TPA: hypothetical protein VMM12_02110 [Longimicrobiales bacterium]|nr:hypothetical protein [Longimicrobiales bacterium]